MQFPILASEPVSSLTLVETMQVHDRALADYMGIGYPKDFTLWRSDLGFLSHNPVVKVHLQPKNAEPPQSANRPNHSLDLVRVGDAIAGVKISRIAKDWFRNTAGD